MKNPVPPGKIIRDLCLKPLQLSVTQAADGLGVTRKTLSLLLNGHAGISPEMAMRLSQAFGRSPESWLQLQAQYDLAKLDSRSAKFNVKPFSAHQGVHP
ncbi:MAG: HigA family addiction module antidote protein [Magnetococcales bacterium]|nr:HigA family addiction module antidote protein [Magnetococcales bacterium]